MSTALTDLDTPEIPGESTASSSTPKVRHPRKPFDADAFLLNLAPYVMGCLLVACLGSVWLAAATAVPPTFAHGSVQPGSGGHMANTAGILLDWVSNSTDAVAVLVREGLIAAGGGK
jgi:hypothetical protein